MIRLSEEVQGAFLAPGERRYRRGSYEHADLVVADFLCLLDSYTTRRSSALHEGRPFPAHLVEAPSHEGSESFSIDLQTYTTQAFLTGGLGGTSNLAEGLSRAHWVLVNEVTAKVGARAALAEPKGDPGPSLRL